MLLLASKMRVIEMLLWIRIGGKMDSKVLK